MLVLLLLALGVVAFGLGWLLRFQGHLLSPWWLRFPVEQSGLLQGVAMPDEFLELRLAVLELRVHQLSSKPEIRPVETDPVVLVLQRLQRLNLAMMSALSYPPLAGYPEIELPTPPSPLNLPDLEPPTWRQ